MLIAGFTSTRPCTCSRRGPSQERVNLWEAGSDRAHNSTSQSFDPCGDFNGSGLISNHRPTFVEVAKAASWRNRSWAAMNRTRAIVAAITLLTGCGFLQAQSLFQPPGPSTMLSAGSQPSGVAVADFAHSGYSSVAVANMASNTITVYLGNGPGTFAPPTTISTCAGPQQLITADFNNDSYPDLAVACTAANEVQMFLNNREGGFIASTAIAVGASPVSLVAGDFNEDGFLDLAVANSGDLTVSLVLSQSTSGNISYTTSTLNIDNSAYGIAVGEFNSSGHLDLAVTDYEDNAVRMFLGDGKGNFATGAVVGVSPTPTGIVAVDLNHDGNTDLAVLSAGGGTVTICMGNGDDAFNCGDEPIHLVVPSATTDSLSIVAVDLNGDGNLDLVANGLLQNEVYALLGNGDGTFQPSQQDAGDGNNTAYPTQAYPVADAPAYLAVGDFNRDGKPDLAVTEYQGGSVALLINNTLPTPQPGGDSFAAPVAVSGGNGNMADSVAVQDFNRDGKQDVAIAYLEDNTVGILLNQGAGTFGTATFYPVGHQPYAVTSGDLNGDGYPDLVTANTADGTVSVLLNKGTSGAGTFASAVTYSVGHDPFQVAIGDLNGDGIPDLAVANNGDNTISILYGAAGGTFTAGPTLTTGTQPYGIAIGDFSNNGVNDIAVTCYSTSQLYVFSNNGSGAFGSPNIYSTDTNPAGLVIGDFNRDGKLDIVTGNTTANDISFFAGNGDGTFQAAIVSGALNFPNSVAVGDINGDGIPDVVTNASNFNEVAVLLGKGDGTFQTRATFNAGTRPWAVAVGDFNNDGKTDIATANVYNTVDLATVADQQRYETEYPPITGGNPSFDVLLNTSGTVLSLSNAQDSYTPIAYNASVTLGATVAPALGGATPTGSVIFEDNGGVVLGTAPSSLTSGAASLTLTNVGSGLHFFTVLYSGDANYQPNNTAVNPGYLLFVGGTTVNLSLASSTVTAGSDLTYTVTVGTPGDGTTDPSGTITLYGILPSGGTQAFDSAQTLVGNGNGTSSVSHSVNPGVTPGNYMVYAVYTPGTGSSYSAGSSSNAPLTIVGLPTSITLGCEAETYFGFPTGDDECYSQVSASGSLLDQGNVAFVVNGGSQNVEAIQDVADYYSTPTLIGYYATYIFTAPMGNYTATATFQQQEVGSTYYAGSSTTGTY